MDSRLFRNAMGKFATGVTVITTKCDDDVHGMTANAFMSVSLDPKLVVVSVGHNATMHEKIKKAGRFAVSILSDEQEEMSMYFAGQIKDKREIEFDWFNDLPVISGSLANVMCRVYEAHPAGDHTLYIGEVEDIFVKEEGAPLAFFEGKYCNIS
ncbi:flavin reductase family protein [Pseudalkalibacillus caeni]|uniref:Flavin reductase family protein n=1 Tax=Exobacillus caeni TaxID=2574798 RepID=A0A5R9F315_9BACL|nr:flavin reductase family protein [Pseudalkalibacillus caeni]TLS36880.1 flavin reductase family protein [Pseudalkalibacillus caeni]